MWRDTYCRLMNFSIHLAQNTVAFPVAVLSFTYVFIVVQTMPALAENRPLPQTCSYELRIWNVNQKRSVGLKTVRHSYSQLAPEEIDPLTGCTVCTEDQSVISIPPLPSFSVCYKLTPKVRSAIEALKKKRAPMFNVVGYRAIKSRGPVDKSGNRTVFSNHSYGTAIDINPEKNGLYDNCPQFGPACKLIRGGAWRSGAPGTLDANSDIVTTLKQQGFKWGGEIAGKQKDFMHFSLTGY